MATQHAVLTVLGGDRPGLVDEVSAFVLDCGANLEDSRMVNLRGQFAIMMLVAGSEAVMVRLRDKLGTLRRDGGVHAELTDAEVDQPCTVGATIPYRLTTTAMDHPGLMQSIAHLLRAMNVNIESADTTLRCAPVSGTPLFERMTAEGRILLVTLSHAHIGKEAAALIARQIILRLSVAAMAAGLGTQLP